MSGAVYHNDAPVGTEFYVGLGRKCPNCNCFFSNSFDLEAHRNPCRKAREARMGWKRSSDGNGEYCGVEKDPELVRQIKTNGNLVMNMRKYRISYNGKWIIREPLEP